MRAIWDSQEGILLQSIPYLESRRILKVFTKEGGLLSFIGIAKRLSLTTPFCKAEWIFKQTSGDLFSIKEASLLDPYLHLRESYEKIKAAGSIANDLLRSQLSHKPAPKLYALLAGCLENLDCNPIAISQSFRLKLLRFDGLIHLQPLCMECKNESIDLSEGQSVCSIHGAYTNRSLFTKDEWAKILALGLAHRFSDLQGFSVEKELLFKLDRLFNERIY